MALQHLRSSTANKRPLPAGMSDGQLAINTNLASPGLFLKNSNGDLVKVGPVHVGTTAPNVSPAAGGETGNTTGELWLDTSLTPNELKTWNGSSWVSATGQEIPVSKLIDGSARQLLQTDAAGTGVEWTSNVDVPGTLDVTSTATFDSIASHPLGSAGAPTITFTGDTNTGIYSPGAGQVAVSTGGSGKIFIAADGKLGVLTASPSTALAVAGGISGTGALNISGGGWGVLPYVANSFVVDSVSGQTRLFATGTDASTHGNMLFFTGTTNGTGAERLRITSAGLVGVGTSSPAYILETYQGGSGGVVVGASLAASGNGGAGRGVGLMFKAPGNANSVEVARIDGRQNTANGTANAATLNFMVANTSGTLTERLTIDSSGRVGIGTTSPGYALDVKTSAETACRLDSGSGNNAILRFAQAGVNKAFINYQNGGGLTFGPAGSEAARLDSSGRLLVGTSSAVAIGGESNPKLQLIDASATSAGWFNLARFTNSAGANAIQFGKSRGTTVGDYTIVQNNDALGSITFAGSDGTDLGSYGAQIKAEVDGTPGANDMPGRLVFSTTSDGASSPTERLRITSAGLVGIGTSSPLSSVSIGSGTISGRPASGGPSLSILSGAYATTGSGASIELGNGHGDSGDVASWLIKSEVSLSGVNRRNAFTLSTRTAFNNIVTERFRITHAGLVGIGTTSPTELLHVNAASGNCIAQITGGDTGTARLRFGGQTDNSRGEIEYDVANDFMAFKTNNLAERARIDSDGRLLLGLSSSIGGAALLQVQGSGNRKAHFHQPDTGSCITQFTNSTTGSETTDGLLVGLDSTEDGMLWLYENKNLTFATNSTERMRIDSDGRLLVGTSTARTLLSQSMGIQIETTDYPACGLSIVNNQNADANPLLLIGKSRGATLNSNTIVQSGDTLGEIHFLGADGSAMLRAASIRCLVDGTPGR
jgi:hypothetical protein